MVWIELSPLWLIIILIVVCILIAKS